MTHSSLVPPSAHLPPIRQIRVQPVDVLAKLVDYLRVVYNPPVRGSRRIKRNGLKDAPDGWNLEDGEDVVAELRADEFERAYAVRWLTGLVSQASLLEDPAGSADVSASSDSFETKVDTLVRSAASLIAICAGTSAARTLTRRYQFASPLLNSDVEVQVRDVPIAVDEDAPSVGTQTWGGACVLAEMLVEHPGRFGLPQDGLSRAGKRTRIRVLELGAGTGLVSLALSQYLTAVASETVESEQNVTVVASDYHPLVLENLRYNIKTNFPAGTPTQLALEVCALDWSTYSRNPPSAAQTPFDDQYDLILGADVVYEPAHALWVRDCVSALLRRPTGEDQPRFHMVMPLRPTHAWESQHVQEVFPLAAEVDARGPSVSHKGARTDWQLCTLEQENIVCEAGETRGREEVVYVHYAVGWV